MGLIAELKKDVRLGDLTHKLNEVIRALNNGHGHHKTQKKKGKKGKKHGKTRKINQYFRLMLDAKKHKKPFFHYKGKKYVGSAHPRLGMIYRSSK
jgi:hypothetical protein